MTKDRSVAQALPSIQGDRFPGLARRVQVVAHRLLLLAEAVPHPTVTIARFQIPIVKLDRRFSRIQLPSGLGSLRPREVLGSRFQSDQLKVFICVGFCAGSFGFVLPVQPLAEPKADVVQICQ